jgi:hypothetical protein
MVRGPSAAPVGHEEGMAGEDEHGSGVAVMVSQQLGRWVSLVLVARR